MIYLKISLIFQQTKQHFLICLICMITLIHYFYLLKWLKSRRYFSILNMSFKQSLKTSKHIIQTWDYLYSEDLKKCHRDIKEYQVMPLENKEVHTFGDFEDFHQRKEGSYSVILNTIYALKKGSPMIDKAKDQRCTNIQYQDPSFKGWFAKAIIVYIDIDNPVLIWPSQNTKKTQNFITMKIFQFCKGHALLILDDNKKIPQILTKHLVEGLLKVKALLPNFTFGYNGQGAGSTLNYFHFQLIQTGALTGGQLFHFETIKGEELKRIQVSLKEKPSPAKMVISIFEFIGAIFVRIKCENYQLSEPQLIPSVSQIVMKVIQMTFKEGQQVPHNLNYPDQNSIYIILRNFSTQDTRFGWIEYSGIYRTIDRNEFSSVTCRQIGLAYQHLSFKKIEKDRIRSELKELFKA